MEAVLEVYDQPYDPQEPVVCFDERPVQLVSKTRTPLPAQPGQPQRYDYEYKREGTCNLFAFFQPLQRQFDGVAIDKRKAETRFEELGLS